ncbi:Alpha-L-arabinofuranosidase [Treponema sp. JC4]|uniref:alpha-N-arabinofuranosidase n=1 Tax=Treponema sp. JC4 TaxID=1124982 RepID=UPI00025B0C8E|nr:alpha-L-arabinofuranosidase C-terminal domain-containing protein [Treponema sp. JC4]EID84609.1 Alpha-L-arabinofuranosidase [Treponema sp. JC4]
MKETVIVDVNNKLSKISPDIYGHFSEHLGRCIYGGFWVGKNSDIPNIHGYNKAVVEAFKELDIPNLRWPGGCFADEYHWMDGIGPLEKRKKMVNTHWGGLTEDNSFGTHEFFGLCDELGCKPYVCGNVGSGSAREINEWIEYMTLDGVSPMADLRKANGREKPWKLDYFGVGNENWGCGGNMRPEYYADLYRQYQTYVRQYGDNKIFKIAGGANVDDYNWTETLMRLAAPFMDGLSLHYYTYEYRWEDKKSATGFDKEGWYRIMRNAFRMEELVRRHSEIMDKYDPDKRIAMVVDEWGNWFAPKPGTNPGFLEQDNSVCDAVEAAIILNIFNNHSDRVRIANLAQAVNVLQAPVLTQGDKVVLTPTWHVLHQFKGHMGGTLLGTSAAYASCGVQNVSDYNAGLRGIQRNENIMVPGLSVSASVKACDKCGKDRYLVTLANTDCESSKDVEITFANFAGNLDEVSASLVSGDKMNTINSFENPELVTEKALSVKVTGKNSLMITMPAHSVAAVSVKA